MATKVTHTQIARYNVTMYPQRLSPCHTVNVIQCNKHQLAYIATQTMQSRTQNIPFFPLPSTKPAENGKYSLTEYINDCPTGLEFPTEESQRPI